MYNHKFSSGKRVQLCLVLGILSFVVAACGDISSWLGAISTRINVDHLVPKVLSVRPHDTTSYTEGLVWRAGTLYESAGLYGQSSLRQVDPQTGKVVRQLKLSPQYFGEGLALAGDRL